MSSPINQKEYLKKYLKSGDDRKRKKKSKSDDKHGSRVIDDEVKVRSGDYDDSYMEAAEFAPVIVNLPESEKPIVHDSDRWKSMAPTESNHRKRHDSDSEDNSPPRRSQQYDSDQSPDRFARRSPSPPQPKRGYDHDRPQLRSNGDARNKSPQRSRQRHDSDNSPPRQPKRHHSPPDDRQREVDRRDKRSIKPARTMDGKAAGLQDAQSVREENRLFKEKEREMYENATDEVSGRGAETQVRGERRRHMEEKIRRKQEKMEKDKELASRYKDWNKGVAQVADSAVRVAEDLHEMSKPLARYAGDEDLENHLKSVTRDGDPMAGLIAKKKEAMQGQGELIPRYVGEPWQNRFGIRPGYRWDGVDRSNGFEQDFLAKGGKRKAVADAAYKWSTEDM